MNHVALQEEDSTMIFLKSKKDITSFKGIQVDTSCLSKYESQKDVSSVLKGYELTHV